MTYIYSTGVLLFAALLGVSFAEENADIAEKPEDIITQIEYAVEENAKSNIEQLVDLICTCRNEAEKEEAAIHDVIDPLNPNPLPRDCYDILQLGQTTSGRYDIYPYDSQGPLRVWCDMDTDEGGWTVFQRREDGSVDFYRDWVDYKNGFGTVTAEHWLGNDNIYLLTLQRKYILRVDLEDFEGATRYATYDHFRITAESEKYKLLLGKYQGDAGDSLTYNVLQSFSTRDVENDSSSGRNCAKDFNTGAWWFNECSYSNLNGQYLRGTLTTAQQDKGVSWDGFKTDKYSLKFTEMKVRPATGN